MSSDPLLIQKMTALADEWAARGDQRAVFLRCYSMMTANMLEAIAEGRFQDQEWVERLLHRFADYYFDALACFDCGDPVPPVWRDVHEAAAADKIHVLQHLLLGVNAHINYDLVLTLEDMLRPEWNGLTEADRQRRYADHCLVNAIIGETIDRVQDEVVEQYAPRMDWVDKLLGRWDERILLHLISSWREGVWDNTQLLLSLREASERQQHLQKIEADVLRLARWLKVEL
jgi:hypothetical protein